MVTNSTNINKRTTTSQLKSLNRKKDQDTILVSLHISTILSWIDVPHFVKIDVFPLSCVVVSAPISFPCVLLKDSCFIYYICIYLRILVFNTIVISNDVYVV